jgi:hypothetical protein
VNHIMEKRETSDRTEAVAIAIQQGVISIDSWPGANCSQEAGMPTDRPNAKPSADRYRVKLLSRPELTGVGVDMLAEKVIKAEKRRRLWINHPSVRGTR